jgi:hypothetical protein
MSLAGLAKPGHDHFGAPKSPRNRAPNHRVVLASAGGAGSARLRFVMNVEDRR